MPRRTGALALIALMTLAACGSSDDPPVATLAPVAPPAAGPASGPAPGPPGAPPPAVTAAPDYGPPPAAIITDDDLDAIEGADGYAMQRQFIPPRLNGLCESSTAYEKVWAVEAAATGQGRLFGQTVFELPDAAAAEQFMASLQSAEQGCEWSAGPFKFEYVRQETGVTPNGDSMFAVRQNFSPESEDFPEQPGLVAYVQVGARIIMVGAPAETSLDVVDQVLALSVR